MIPAPNAEQLIGILKLKADHDRYEKALEEIVRRRISSGRNIPDWGILDLSEKALRGEEEATAVEASTAPVDEVDVDGREVKEGVILIGKASRQPDGKWLCLANVFGSLCRVEVYVTFKCSECKGTGEIGLADGDIVCPKCYGSGDPFKPGVFKPKA